MGLEFKNFDIDAEVDSLVFNIMMQNSMGLEEDEITDITDDIDFYEELEQVNTERVKNGEEPLTLEEFLDCLDFAPDGVKEIIKTMAVELELNDVAKRDAILEKLNFNVNNAIDIKRKINEGNQEKATAPIRRRAAKKENGQPVRRVKVEK